MIKKIVTVLLCVTIVSTATEMSVSAAETSTQDKLVINHSEDISVYSQDVIVYKYRYYYGKVQYRRWNETKGVWVDSKWINM